MDELTRPIDFNQAVLNEYKQQYAVTAAAEKDNVEFVVGPKLNTADWDTFANGTEECLNKIIGNIGVPLSYVIRNDTLHPALDPATATQSAKLYWNVIFAGASFRQDQVWVWGYLAQHVIGTSGWNTIKIYQSTSNACQAWLDLQMFYAGPAESWKKMIVARAALKVLKYKNEETFLFATYVIQMMGHFQTFKRGGQGESEVQKVTKLLDQIENDHSCLQTAIEIVSNGFTFREAITRLSITIESVYPLMNQKGRKSLISETGPCMNDFKTTLNGLEITGENWENRFSDKDYKRIPIQI